MAELVKVKILKSVGTHSIGAVVELSKDEADQICIVRKYHDGAKLVESRLAMPLKEFEDLKAAPFDKGGLSQGELAEMGAKNVVPTPADPLFESQLAAKKKGQTDAQEKAAAKRAAVEEISNRRMLEDDSDSPGLIEQPKMAKKIQKTAY